MSSSNRMYEVLGDVYGLSNELGDYVDGIELGKIKMNGGIKTTMQASMAQLEELLPEALKFRSATGGDVLDTAERTLEKARTIVEGKKAA